MTVQRSMAEDVILRAVEAAEPPLGATAGRSLEPIKTTVCTECEYCPEVKITDYGVTIGLRVSRWDGGRRTLAAGR